MRLKSTPAMRDRARELVVPSRDDFDRAVNCILDDFDTLSAAITTLIGERDALERNRDMWRGQCDRQAGTILELRIEMDETDTRAKEAEKALEEATRVLRSHHNWHTESGAIGLPDGEGGWIEIDNGAEYCDSSLYERTAKILDDLPPEWKPAARPGSGDNHWANWVLAVRRIKKLEAALAPFSAAADVADHRSEEAVKFGLGRLTDNASPGLGITFGHLRNARALHGGK